MSKQTMIVLVKGSHVSRDSPDPDPCHTKTCGSPPVTTTLMASVTAANHPSWGVLPPVHAQASGAS